MRLDSPDIIGTLTISTVNNATGDILTYSGTTVTRRTPAQLLTDIGASSTSHNHTLDSLSNVTITSNTNGEILRWNGSAWINNTLAEAGIQSTITAAALTKTDDTNVTLTLGGSPTTSLLAATSLTLGWSGQLAVSRGGTGASTLTGVLIGNGTSAVTAVAGTASQLLRRNSGNTAYEFFTHDFINQAGARTSISLTTTGSSGAATYSSSTGVFNIPNYTLVGLGGFANPMTTLGDVIYGGASGTPTRLAGNTTTAKQYLSQTGTGTISAIPSWSTIAGSDITGSALTASNDTNVTLTLGGTPTTALLRAASLTLGWTGTLAIARGGTGLSALGTANQLLRVNAGATALEYFTPSFLTAAITSLNGLTGATQTFANDTNVTITSATTTHTIGWSGQLAVSRGGTGASTLTGVLIGNGTSAVTAVAGTASQILRRNSGNTAYEFFTIAGSDITGAALTKTDDTNVTLTLGGTPATALLRAASLTLGWTGQLAVGRGGTGASTLTGVVIGNGTSAMTAVAGTASQVLRRNAGNTAYEFFTQTLTTISDVTITTPSNGQVLQYNGSIWVNATPAAAGVTGSGTTNYVAKFTGTTAIGNSLIQDTGVGIGFNTAPLFSHLFSFKVATNLNLTIDDNRFSSLSINAYSDAGSNIDLVYSALNHIFDAFGSERMRIVGSNGNVLIGTSTDNSSRLRVNGTTFIEPTSTSTNGLIIRGLASQAADVLVVQNSSASEVFKVNSNGDVTFNGQIYSPVNAKGNSGTGTVTFNWNDGNIQTVTLTGNCTFAFSNPQSGASYQIIITQDGTGSRTITWPTIHWENKTVPSLTGTLNSKDIVTLTYDGTNYNGIIAKNFGTP